METAKDYAQIRLEICSECPRLFKRTYTCKECGCFMKIKTNLKNAECPLGKWGKYEDSK
jgi:hypothetical protein